MAVNESKGIRDLTEQPDDTERLGSGSISAIALSRANPGEGVRVIRRVLVLGATGFIGGHVCAALRDAGIHVIAGSRRIGVHHSANGFPASDTVQTEQRFVNFRALIEPPQWEPLLKDVDAVVNLVGIFRETQDVTFDLVHRQAPVALFEACERLQVPFVIQMSALGADDKAVTPFHRSKKAADDDLAVRNLKSMIVQPSLVFGLDGASSQLFLALATMGLLALPGGGRQKVQPVHVDDIARLVANVLRSNGPVVPVRVVAVGPAPLTFLGYLRVLRRGMAISQPLRVIPLSPFLTRLTMPVAAWLSSGTLSGDAVAMLEQGSTGDVHPFSYLLGRPARDPGSFISSATLEAVRLRSQSAWLAPVLRWSLAFVWIATAAVSFGLYPTADSFTLLGQAGVPAAMRPLALYGAAALDLVLGLLCLAPRRPRWTWLVQIALIIGYTAIITIRLPEFWMHPYGPLTKNIPMLAALLYLHITESPKWTTSR